MSTGYNNNPQSMLSSRVYTNNMFKVDETRKAVPINREKINLNLNNNDEHKNMIREEGGIHSIHTNDCKKSPDDYGCGKSVTFDDRIVISNKASCFICCNRLMYSRKCVIFYIFLIVFSIFVFGYSIFGYFAKLGKKISLPL